MIRDLNHIFYYDYLNETFLAKTVLKYFFLHSLCVILQLSVEIWFIYKYNIIKKCIFISDKHHQKEVLF